MNNSRLIELLQTELGKGKITNKGNIAFCCPFCSTTKKKLEIQSITSESGEKHRNGVKLAKLGGRNPNAKKCIWLETGEEFESGSTLLRHLKSKHCIGYYIKNNLAKWK